MTRLSEDQLHDLLNIGIAEDQVEVLATLDTEEGLERVDIEAISGVESARGILKTLLKRNLVSREEVQDGNRKVYWRLAELTLDRDKVLRHLPKGVKARASDPEISGPIIAHLNERRLRIAKRKAAERGE